MFWIAGRERWELSERKCDLSLASSRQYSGVERSSTLQDGVDHYYEFMFVEDRAHDR